MPSRAPPLALSLLLATAALAALAPPAAASSSVSCTATGSTSASGSNTCAFPCAPGDTISIFVDLTPVPYYASYGWGTASCGGAVASCTANAWDGDCGATAPTPSAGDPLHTGTCTISALAGTATAYCSAEPAVTVGDVEEAYNTYADREAGAQSPDEVPTVGGFTYATPPVGTPGVGAVSSPPVGVPACGLSPCTAPTPYGPVSTPPLEQACDPVVNQVCVGPVAPIGLVPAGSVPAACALAPALCDERAPLVPGGTVTTPPVGAITLLGPQDVVVPQVGGDDVPTAGAYVSYTPTGLGTPTVGTEPYGPYTTPGPVPVTVCASQCPVPTVSGNGELVVQVNAAGESEELRVTT